MMSNPIHLFYDDQCTLCKRFKEALSRLPEQEVIVSHSIHDETIYTEFNQLTIEECHRQVHIIIDGGVVLKGPEAVSHLIKLHPAIAKIAWLIDSDMGQKSMTFFYDMAEKYRRSLLNNCKTCKKY
jgi:predicted DCC family thiol-disulfide oxidoreductase YuxK